MSNYVKLAAETGDRYLAALEAGQNSFLQFVTAYSKLAPPPVAMTGGISALRECSAASFALTEQFLEQQQAMCEKYFKAAPGAAAKKPVNSRETDSANKSASKVASTPVAVKSSKRKRPAKPRAVRSGSS